MADKTNPNEAQKKLTSLLDDFHVGMLTTRQKTGGLRARPMIIAEVSDAGDMSFLTTVPSGLVEEIEQSPEVCVALQGRAAYASVTGKGRVRMDPRRVDELWNRAFDAWFPDGSETKDLAVVEVQAESGEMWDQRGMNAVRLVIEAGRAMAEGRRPDPDKVGDHASAQLS